MPEPCSGSPTVDNRSNDKYTVHINELRFVWDRRKSLANLRKHGVSFEEARTAFYDENARVYLDPDHSEDEARFILLGLTSRQRIAVVCHCYREEESVIRVISARGLPRRPTLRFPRQGECRRANICARAFR